MIEARQLTKRYGSVAADRYWPTAAGEQIFRVQGGGTALSPWDGFAVLCAFAAVVVVAAGWLLDRRDA